MNPIYRERFYPFADLAMSTLLQLPWLKVTEARQEYFMSDVPRKYTYGKGVGEREYTSADYSSLVQSIREVLNHTQNCQYNVCFLNRYDTQHNQLGWHADDSPTMDREHPIAVISFGAEREIWWRKNGDKGVVPPENRQLLAHGSLFVMPACFQDTHQHRIPKCDRSCGTRISLTFRRYG